MHIGKANIVPRRNGRGIIFIIILVSTGYLFELLKTADVDGKISRHRPQHLFIM